MPDGPDAAARLADAMARIWESSLPAMTTRLVVVESAAIAAVSGSLGADLRADAEREAHKLAGSLGTFGRHEGTRLAREIELLLQGEAALAPDDALRLAELAEALAAQLDGAGATTPTSPDPERAVRVLGHTAAETPHSSDGLLLVVDGDEDRARRVAEVAAAAGLEVTTAAGVPHARDVLAGAVPAAAVVDGAVRPGTSAVLDLVADLAGRGVTVTVLVGDAGVDRVAAAAAGGRVVLEATLPPATIVDATRRALARLAAATVLAVDDDDAVLAAIEAILAGEGMRVERLGDPTLVWRALDDVRPDLLLLDADMPGLDGVALCRALRADETWRQLPVVFLTGRAGPEAERAMFDAGADDHLRKPVVADELVARVLARLRRHRTLAEAGGVDPETALPSRASFDRAVTRLLALGRRHDEPVVVAVLGVDAPAGIVAHDAMASLARVARRACRNEDAVGRLDTRRLAVALYGERAASGVERARRAVDEFGAAAPPRTVAVAGVATFPVDGGDGATLVAAASAAFDRALAEGEGVVAASSGDAAETVDVLVVDDDEALGALLLHALGTAGMSTRWLRDGAEAAAALTTGALAAHVVLLDVGLPGLDGVALLRRLAETGRLARTRVIMVTLRSTEAEVLEALRLGAFDHVAKPFSLPVLVERVRRALSTL